MDLINNLIPTKVDDDYLQDKMLNGDNKNVALNRWYFNDKIYAKIYFASNTYDDDNFSEKIIWHSVICKSRYYHQFHLKAKSNFEYIIEFYTDKDFEINPIWEGVYTDE